MQGIKLRLIQDKENNGKDYRKKDKKEYIDSIKKQLDDNNIQDLDEREDYITERKCELGLSSLGLSGKAAPCCDSYDIIKYIVVSTEYYDVNLYRDTKTEKINKFMELMGCLSVSIWLPETKEFNTLKLGSNVWKPCIHTKIIALADEIKQKYPKIIFCIYDMDCDGNMHVSYTFRVLSNIQSLDYCNIFSTYNIDFKTYRKDHYAVLCVFEAEGG